MPKVFVKYFEHSKFIFGSNQKDFRQLIGWNRRIFASNIWDVLSERFLNKVAQPFLSPVSTRISQNPDSKFHDETDRWLDRQKR